MYPTLRAGNLDVRYTTFGWIEEKYRMKRSDLLQMRLNAVQRKNELIDRRRELKSFVDFEPVASKKQKMKAEIFSMCVKISAIDKEIMDINIGIARLNESEDYQKKLDKEPDLVSTVDVAEFATNIRDKWKEYAEDRTRIASVRVVANDALKDIQKIVNLMGMK